MNGIRKYLSAILLPFFLMFALGCASTAKQEGTGEYVDDAVVSMRVRAVILNEPTLKVGEISVETYKGVVQLSGFVSTQTAVFKAAELARTVKGVMSVKNDILVK